MDENNFVSTDPTQNSSAASVVTNNFVSTDPTQNIYASDAVGMPTTDSSGAPAANLSVADPDSTPAPSGLLGTLESWGSSAVSKVEGAVSTVYGGVKTVASDVVNGAENTVTGVTSSLTGDILLILGVVVVGLVLVAKSGAIKITKSL